MQKVVKSENAKISAPEVRISKLLEAAPFAQVSKCDTEPADRFRVELGESSICSHQFVTSKHSPVIVGIPGTPWIRWQVIERSPSVCVIQFINKGPAKTIEVSFF